MAKREVAETDPKFSVDLIKKAQLSGGALSKLSRQALESLLQRYKKFWQLVKANPDKRLMPPRDVDEMWHIHLLYPVDYARDCLEYFRHILDHNTGFIDTDEERQKLARLSKSSKAIWDREFRDEPYRLDVEWVERLAPKPCCAIAGS